MLKLPNSLYERMIDAFAGQDSESLPPKPRASAAVVPWRVTAGELEVYWVRRAPTLPFMGGWHAFPGGGLSKKDLAIEMAEPPVGISQTATTPGQPGLDPAELQRLGPDLVPGLAVAALRELFEETGLLIGAPQGLLRGQDLEHYRRRLLAKEISFSALVAKSGCRLDATRLTFAGRWLTPPFAPGRFDNRFFLFEWKEGEDPPLTVDGGELDHGEWLRPGDALARWQRGQVLAAPPILHILRVMEEEGPRLGLPRLLDTRQADLGPMRRIEFRPGVLMLPLRTPTLPPAGHTNAFLLGHGECVLIDPASPLPREIETLKAVLHAAEQDLGRRTTAIWLTHHHPDHVGGVEAIRQHLGVPVLAHKDSIEPLRARGIEVDGTLQGDTTIRLRGTPELSIRVLHTPGHARGHLSFWVESQGTLITGDLIAGLGTIVIDPPEGDMDAYLDSLSRMDTLAPALLLPSHGPPLARQAGTLKQYQVHREERERAILQAWSQGHRTHRDIVAEVYTDLPAMVRPIAERQVEAHLIRLRKLGEITDEMIADEE
jgi:glyoxylase-like metal-dependent hydrolase (beta-lactamase superfamily II)/8-oxo-dGTP pyrophosphatase MutT (NUDIX family)